ncbi:OmpA/MotB family protein [Maridesulfovibrio salexigens]|uniref:OmpA/MotB domain protein n=1 Tax=Maridesulfovibrio salexigens (strain ATCC 14822 / DSM 2638 / NCIMB 8403 / VKM B-1763) TaxID=526222 RepID=C6BXY7_MARSD|nr:OmpA family protein [Maridesulfovibrio salexigens]ACS80517.1 OmpA/MotB domain protein [Maridesulfovibrio salexigens DSM 2638]
MKFDEMKCELDLMEFKSGDADTSGMNGWAVPWSDLMMVMFVLFVVLFIYSQSKENIKVIFEGNAQSEVAMNPADGLIEMISFHRDAMSSSARVIMTPEDVLYRSDDGAVSMKEEDGELKIVMRGNAFFAPGQNIFEDKTRQYLAEVAEVLKTSKHAIHIIGHTDASDAAKVGAQNSFELSARRAAKVAEFLINTKSIDPVRIIVSGRGGVAPELPDDMGKVEGNNRRVEIVVINTDVSAQ